MIDRKNKIILLIMAAAVLFAINFNQLKRHYIYQETAREVFLSEGLDPSVYMKGIDFSKPVRILHVKKDDVLIQYQTPNVSQGNFYALLGAIPTELGINDFGIEPETGLKVRKRLRVYIATKDVDVLSSYAKAIVDDWSTPEDEAQTEGSKQQFFSTCKPCFKLK
ncbi:MAG: polymorphic toxin type 46 domain-containing protein [Candidatus Heimdallarchaeaceae archaeon]